MKGTIYLFVVALLVGCEKEPQRREEGKEGRYQLMTGTWTPLSGKDERVVMRIDTHTGEVCTYTNWTTPKGDVVGWQRVTEPCETYGLLKQLWPPTGEAQTQGP